MVMLLQDFKDANDFFQYEDGFLALFSSFCADSVIIGNRVCAKTLPAYFCCLQRT